MKIPKSFQLHGRSIQVAYDPDLVFKNDLAGCAAYREDRIYLQPSTKGHSVTQKSIEQTFCHELAHWLLHMAGEHELNSNEKFIDVLSGLLHQYFTTSKT